MTNPVTTLPPLPPGAGGVRSSHLSGHLVHLIKQPVSPAVQECQICHPNWVRLVLNETNLGLFKISFSTFWLAEPKCTETDLRNSQICPI